MLCEVERMVTITILQGTGRTWQQVTSSGITTDITVKDENNLLILQVQNVSFVLLRVVQEVWYKEETSV